jgi:TP901 family phage tail tape measure protein
MADVLKEVRIMFEGTDNVSKVIDGLSGKLDSFAGSVKGATQPLADMAAGVLKVETALAALAAGGLILAFNESKKFENATIELQKVIGDEGDKLGEAQQDAINLSDTYGVAAHTILSATADWVQAGFNVQESMGLTKAAMDLVIAGNLGASEATEILIATLKGFKAPAEDAVRIVDILNEVSNKYATDVRQLGIGMSELSPIAHLMGFSFEETAGILTPVIEVFRDGGEAANALKTGLLRIVDDRKPVMDALEQIGVSQRDLNGNLKSGKEILYEVAAAFQKLSPEQQIFFAQNLVGIEQAGRMVEVFSNLANVQEVTAVALKASGSAAQEVALRLQSAEVAVNRFIAAAGTLGVAIGDQFRMAAKEAFDGGTAIEIVLRGMVTSGTFAPVLDLVRDFATQLGIDLKAIAKILPEAFAGVDWTKLTDSMKAVGASIVGLFQAAFGDVDLTTVEGLQSAVQKVVNGIAALSNVTAGILQSWEPFVRKIAEAAQKFAEADGSSQTFAGNILGLGQAINAVANNFGILTGALSGISLALEALALTSIVNTVKGFGGLATAVGGAVAALGPFQAIAVAIGAGWVLDKVLDATVPKWQENKQAIADTASMLSGASEATGEWIGASEDVSKSITSQKTLWQDLTEAMDAIPETVTTGIETEGAGLAKDEIDEILKVAASLGTKRVITVAAEADTNSINKVKNIIWETLPDGRLIFIQTDYDTARLASTADAIEKAVPKEKEMEIRLKGDIDIEIARIKAQADTLQTAFEWKAKVDIAETEAFFKTMSTQSQSIADMFANTGDTLTGLAAAFADVGGLARLDIFELMEEESRRRDTLLAEQSKLTAAQIKYLEARAKAMTAGQGIVTISAEGLQPELELVLQKIVQLTQIKANEEGLNFLLGMA